MTSLEFARQLQTRFGDLVAEPVEFREEVTVTVRDAGRIAEVCRTAKTELGFDVLLDLTAVDLYGEEPRFRLVYELYGLAHRAHLRLAIGVAESGAEVPSVTGVWRTADWHEREAYDLMGLRFAGHPDLRRIIMWEGYPYHPLRKDFPLAGKPTELPEVAFTQAAPMAGGPFVTVAGGKDAVEREPRVRAVPE